MSNHRYLDKAYQVRTDDDTRKLYDAWAEVYDQELIDENAYRQPDRCADALAALGLDGKARLLDVGCGTGLSGLALRDRGYSNIDGCDLSERMLAKAQLTGCYQRLFIANLNAPPLDAADSSYDAATAVGVFSFGHIRADALEEILRLLKPGAPLVIGLNDHFYQQGTLSAKLAELAKQGRVRRRSETHGEHIPGTGLTGWVMVIEKN